MKYKISAFIITLCILAGLAAPSAACAAGSALSLNQTKLTLYVGNTYQLYLSNAESEEYGYYFYYYQCEWSSSDKKVATVDRNGMVTVTGVGKATVTAVYNGKKYKCRLTAKESRYKLDNTSLKLKTFREASLSITHDSRVSYYGYEVYRLDGGLEEPDYRAFNIYIDDDTGNVELEARRPGKYRIDFFVHMETKSYGTLRFTLPCTADVEAYGLIDENIGCALGASYKLQYGGLTDVTFTSSDPEIATVDSRGRVEAHTAGDATIYMEGRGDGGQTETYSCSVEATDPTVTLEKDYAILNRYIDVNVEGASWYGEPIYETSDENVVAIDYFYPSAAGEGKCTLTVTVDGREFSFDIEVLNPRLESDCYLMTPSSTKSVKLVGLNSEMKKEKIKYSVANEKIATVSSKGKLTAKKAGCTILTVTAGDISFSAGISVGGEAAVNAVKNAKQAVGSQYSQEKRMQKGFYDCSSLIWRSYEPEGVNFGAASYAPTAAELARYLSEKGKIVSKGYTDPQKLQPGDLIFFAGGDNGRFMNINHVSMFVGLADGYDYNYETDEYYDYCGLIVHAATGGVYETYLSQGYGDIVLIARPAKK